MNEAEAIETVTKILERIEKEVSKGMGPGWDAFASLRVHPSSAPTIRITACHRRDYFELNKAFKPVEMGQPDFIGFFIQQAIHQFGQRYERNQAGRSDTQDPYILQK